jgi:hypothetical protein
MNAPFCTFKTFKPLKWKKILLISNIFFPYQMSILTLMIKKEKKIKIDKIHFYNTFKCIWFEHVFGF